MNASPGIQFGHLQSVRPKRFDIPLIPGEDVCDIRCQGEEPLVSIAMITYNHEKYVAEAIESIVGQRASFVFELVIGEDCSKDRTRQIVLEYQRRYPKRIRVVMSDENVGPIANQLRVERACRGKYIAYCEGDDFWQRSDKLQVQVDFLEAHPECSVVYSGYTLLKGGKAKKVTTVPGQTADMANILSFDDILFGNCFQFATCTTVGRRAIIERAHALCPIMSEDLSFGDVTRHLLFASAGHVGFIPEVLGTYRINPGGVSQDIKTCLRFVFDGIHVKKWFLNEFRPGSIDGERRLARQCFPYVFYFAEQTYDPTLTRELVKLAKECGYRLPVGLKMKLALCGGSRRTHRAVRATMGFFRAWHERYRMRAQKRTQGT